MVSYNDDDDISPTHTPVSNTPEGRVCAQVSLYRTLANIHTYSAKQYTRTERRLVGYKEVAFSLSRSTTQIV